LEPEIVKINRETEAFFAEEREKKKKFRASLEASGATSEQKETELNQYRKKELELRSEFLMEQTLKVDKFVCEKENSKKEKAKQTDCKAYLENRKKILSIKYNKGTV
jgi:hypothetical protein